MIAKSLVTHLLAALAATALTVAAQAGTIVGTSCLAFPNDSWWHADVSKLPVHARSDAWMSHMQPSRNLHPDFGKSYGEQPAPYGIPITIVDNTHPTVTVRFDIDDESDHVRYPLGDDTLVEGGQYKEGDRHTLIVNRDTCRLYETWATRRKDGKWRAGSGATWDLTKYKLRPDTWTSGDAAGFPILPLLLTYEEVVARTIDHAIRFTTDVTDNRYIWPARHEAGSVNSHNYPPMGARFRLKESFHIDGSLRGDTRAILRAMKTYGLALADNGTPWFFQGTADKRWPANLIEQLKDVPASAFEAVDTSSLKVSNGSMKIKPQP